MSSRLSRILGSHPDRQLEVARYGITQSVLALARMTGAPNFPLSGRVTMTEAASWLALNAALTPAKWDDWLYDVTRVTDALILVSSPASHRMVISKELYNVPQEEHAASAAALMRWQAEELEALQGFGGAVKSILEHARAGTLQVRGVQKGVAQQLSIDDLNLLIHFDASRNSLVFDVARAEELRSSLTESDVPGWSDVMVRAEQVRTLKTVEEDRQRVPVSGLDVRARVGELIADAIAKGERPGREGIVSAIRAQPSFCRTSVKLIHEIFDDMKPEEWTGRRRPGSRKTSRNISRKEN